jgi:hypothetical protein
MRKQKQYHFIYKTTNLLNGKYYIGMHSSDSLTDGYLGSGKRLRYSINKYGKINHIREILEFCKTREDLKAREIEIVNLNEITKLECMNLKIGGEGAGLPIGFKHSNESKEKMSQSNKGNNRSSETREKQSVAQKESWNETRKKCWGKYMNEFWTDERKKQHGEKIMGHTGSTKCKGVKKHEGFGKLVSAGNIGKPKSETHRENISLARTGKKYPYSRKITKIIEENIMKDLLSGIKVRVIADTYNLSQSVIYRIKNKNGCHS